MVDGWQAPDCQTDPDTAYPMARAKPKRECWGGPAKATFDPRPCRLSGDRSLPLYRVDYFQTRIVNFDAKAPH